MEKIEISHPRAGSDSELALVDDLGIASPQKTAPVFGGGQVALVLSCCESFFGGRTAGEPSARERASGGGFAVYAAPHLSGTTCHGETWSPGPPNCFPSTECVRCRL